MTTTEIRQNPHFPSTRYRLDFEVSDVTPFRIMGVAYIGLTAFALRGAYRGGLLLSRSPAAFKAMPFRTRVSSAFHEPLALFLPMWIGYAFRASPCPGETPADFAASRRVTARKAVENVTFGAACSLFAGNELARQGLLFKYGRTPAAVAGVACVGLLSAVQAHYQPLDKFNSYVLRALEFRGGYETWEKYIAAHEPLPWAPYADGKEAEHRFTFYV